MSLDLLQRYPPIRKSGIMPAVRRDGEKKECKGVTCPISTSFYRSIFIFKAQAGTIARKILSFWCFCLDLGLFLIAARVPGSLLPKMCVAFACLCLTSATLPLLLAHFLDSTKGHKWHFPRLTLHDHVRQLVAHCFLKEEADLNQNNSAGCWQKRQSSPSVCLYMVLVTRV